MNIRDRINQLIQKYDVPYKEQKRAMETTPEIRAYFLSTKQTYLDEFDSAIA
ncbi:hypothetical protein HY496_02360 [Candidatus Woesearchaeota archaeon]|nr:hypothetical protein [Candidatus Woesearchaeota archaeon]